MACGEVVGAETTKASRWAGLGKTIGPGIMYAGAAIGVSHLVQATRAGAGYGFGLVWVVLLVHLVKYPFFEFAHRYTAATGESLLVGYRRIGRWALVMYMVVAFGLSIPTAAALTVVTAGMASQLIPANLTSMNWAIILMFGCAVILATGGYPLLDRLMKVLMIFLAVCTLVAVIAAIGHGRVGQPDFEAPPLELGFLIALMGWMPTPVDASAWPSLWMQARSEQTAYKPTVREALVDFKIGYFGSVVTALMFLSLGAMVMYGSGDSFSTDPQGFAAQFVSMYTSALGAWSRPVVVIAAFITMFSTTLTVLDGYPRVVATGCREVWPASEKAGRLPYWVVATLMMGGALLIYKYLIGRMLALVDFTMILAFLSAPVFAFLNYRVIKTGRMPTDARPPRWLYGLTWVGLLFFVAFSVAYLVWRLWR
ncbi:MAG: Nramp family divalent metal transporter [Phycisphaerae bacterium]|jgi:Mn2+/Fe2+ NRAMP family transporter